MCEIENGMFKKNKGLKSNRKFEFARVHCVIGGYSDASFVDDRNCSV